MEQRDQQQLREIQSEIQSVLGETESATLSLGDRLNEIVQGAEEFVAEIRGEIGELEGGEGGSVGTVLHQQCEAVEGFISQVQGAVEAQDGVADEVLSTSRTVMEAAQAVASISMQSRILCFNTMVEAGRLGEKGRPFMVIAGEMRELSDRIAASNEQVSQLARDLMPLLKDVKRTIADLRGGTEEFAQCYDVERKSIEGITEQLRDTAHRSLAVGDEKIAAIVERSSKALVDLQVQDLVSQRLKRILRLTGVAAEGGEFLSESLDEGDAAAADDATGLEAGDVMLF
ncbi:MAG: methyl-accepting chemotaxis protein [Planctomycetota bacterium]